MNLTTKQSKQVMSGTMVYIKRGNELYKVTFNNGTFTGKEIMTQETKIFTSKYYNLLKKTNLL